MAAIDDDGPSVNCGMCSTHQQTRSAFIVMACFVVVISKNVRRCEANISSRRGEAIGARECGDDALPQKSGANN